MLDARSNDYKLIAANPGRYITLEQDRLNAFRQEAKQPVSGRVAIAIVHRL